MLNLENILVELKISYQRIGQEKDDQFEDIVPLNSSDKGKYSLVFINNPKENSLDLLNQVNTSVVLLEETWAHNNLTVLNDLPSAIFLVKNPRLVVGRILKTIFPEVDFQFEGIHPTAIIDPDAYIHPLVGIGPYCIIGKCSIGQDSKIGAFSIIKDNVTIGKNVTIRENCMVGGSGFGFVRNDDGHLEKIPHKGSVVIEDDVELFPYVNVDRGTLTETRIKRGAKVDHYAHIGHNSLINVDCIVTAGVVMCGGSSLGARSWAGVGAIVKDNVKVGDDVTIGLGGVVLHDVENGKVIAGVPAKVINRENS